MRLSAMAAVISTMLNLLTLPTLLTVLVVPAQASRHENSGDAEHRRPAITATITSGKPYHQWENSFTAEYGDVSVLCSGDVTNLRILDGDRFVQAEELNTTTIRFHVRNHGVGKHTYSCTDGRADSIPLFVSIIPLMAVTARRAPHSQSPAGMDIHHTYLVPLGEDFNVFCSGNEALQIKSFITGTKLETVVVNRTTVRHAARTDNVERLYYRCYSGEFLNPAPLLVMSDHYMEAQNFQCIAYSVFKFQCTWRSYSEEHSFQLFYVHKDGSQDPTLLCFLTPGESGETTKVCTWNNIVKSYHAVYIPEKVFTVLLRCCNILFCDNKTFTFDRGAITKLNSLTDLKLLSTSARGAAVAWRMDMFTFDSGCEFRLEHRLLGADWWRENTSMVRCDYRQQIYETQLYLPCPGSHYELRVYVKLKTATEEKYWSEPASVFFYTDQSTGEGRSPECAAEFEEREPPPSAAVMLHQVRRLISHERKENAALRKTIEALKQKRVKVKELMETIAATGAGVGG